MSAQIRKHKTNHLLIGRETLAAAEETNGSREKGERENNGKCYALSDTN